MSFAWHEIRDHLMHSASTLSFQRRFETIRHGREPIGRFRDPAALLEALHRNPGGPDEKNLILASLIGAVQCDGPAADCALTVLLLALWPGLDAIRHRSIWRGIGAADEIASDVLARTTEAIRGLDLDRVNWVAATVPRNVERDMIRARQREAERERAASDVDPDEVSADRGGQDTALDEAHLRDAMHRLIGADAALVIRVAVEGFSQAEVAIEFGLSEAAARKRFQRATRRLRGALHEFV
jgi:RNA polymerase sigma-70 factor (ECF subfamily)